MSDRKPSIAPWIAGVVLVALGLYVWTYYWMVSPRYFISFNGRAPDPQYTFRNSKVTNRSIRYCFAPIHWVDRRIRPDVWELTP